MARYLLFAGDDFEASGGMDDFIRDFKIKSKLMKFLKESPEKYNRDWWHVADTEKCEIILHDHHKLMKEYHYIICENCGEVLKLVSKSEKPEPEEERILCKSCQSFFDTHDGLY